nr:putative inorganic phosphate transporter 1-12 [Quercus suber]
MQWNYITTIIRMGFFTDAFNLFCISTVSKLLGRLYYYDTSTGKSGKLPQNFNNAVIGVALIGTLTGHLGLLTNLALKELTASLQLSRSFVPYAPACPLVQAKKLSLEHFVSLGSG